MMKRNGLCDYMETRKMGRIVASHFLNLVEMKRK